ncbi:uncharacterized protein K444DRAFT_658763 [Hyaloscypha bicolor E]|uniref:Uncharacterized protein n=1 Tax=Hyaloscypha bicolor E TaxID=1095630 RepID=A0A2J6TTT4_9HELO|nr:uncharacterized protein K444DRAFT_658763 [Hyaloscypha bicolor E]PMD66439.1 hypothetical protein K444DRAFT_658763 [Hyaloscypha bicolor E]
MLLLHSQHANESGLTACSQLGSAGVAFAFRRPSLPSSPSPTSIALPALGTPLDPVWLEGSLGAEVQGSDRGIAHHWGPCPADCPVKQRCGPGVQESKPQSPQSPQTTSSLCRPTSTLPRSHRTRTLTRTLAQRRQPRNSGLGNGLRGAVLADHGRVQRLTGACASRARTLGSLWDHSGITRITLITLGSRSAEPYLGSWRRSTRLNPATSKLASASGETCESLAWRTSPFASLFLSQTTWWWLEPSREDVRLFVDDSVLPNRPTSSLSAVPGESVVLPNSWVIGALDRVSTGTPKALISRGIGLCLLPEVPDSLPESEIEKARPRAAGQAAEAPEGLLAVATPSLGTDRRSPTPPPPTPAHPHPDCAGGATTAMTGEPGSRGGICGSACLIG